MLIGLETSQQTQQLVVFDSASPGTLISQTPISGLVAGDTLVGLTFRPATGGLYALGEQIAPGQTVSRLYTLDPGSGAATNVSPAAGFGHGGNPGSSFSFDPVADQIRLVDTANENLRINPATGAVASVDTALSKAGIPVPSFGSPTSIAYDHKVAGATATTLFGINNLNGFFPSSELETIGSTNGSPDSANSGLVSDLFQLFHGIPFGFDIVPSQTPGGVAYAIVEFQTGSHIVGGDFTLPDFGPPTLITIDLSTGTITSLGVVATGVSPESLAVIPPPRTSSSGGSGSSMPPTSANLSPSQRFVSEAFLDLLGHNPDQNSLSALAGFLDNGLFSRLQLVLGVEHSPEYYAHVVDALYRATLGRPADAGALQAGAMFLATGGSQAELKALLYGSPEYLQKAGGTTHGFLAALFPDVTGQPLDGATEGLLDGLLAAGVSRTALALTLLQTPTASQRQVSRFFSTFLGRLPNAAEVNAHAGLVQAGAADLDLALILASDEFFHQ
jgi:hypothetical protein